MKSKVLLSGLFVLMVIGGFPLAYIEQSQEIAKNNMVIQSENDITYRAIQFNVEESNSKLRIKVNAQGLMGLINIAILNSDSFELYETGLHYLNQINHFFFRQSREVKTTVTLGESGIYYLIIEANFGDFTVDYELMFVSLHLGRMFSGIILAIVGIIGLCLTGFISYKKSSQERKISIKQRVQKVSSPFYKPFKQFFSLPATQLLSILLFLLCISTLTSFIGALVVDGWAVFGWIFGTIISFAAMIITAIILTILKNWRKKKDTLDKRLD